MANSYNLNGRKFILGRKQILLRNIDHLVDFRPVVDGDLNKTKGGIYLPNPENLNRINAFAYATKIVICQLVAMADDLDIKEDLGGIEYKPNDIVYMMKHNIILVATADEMGKEDPYDYIITPAEALLGKIEMDKELLEKILEKNKK